MSLVVQDKTNDNKVIAYQNDVILKYQIYNGLFLGLPFPDVDQAGSRLPIFSKICQDLISQGLSVPEAVDKYLTLVPIPEENKLNLLNKYLQFIERQIVLFDALEDSAFNKINDISGYGSLEYLLNEVRNKKSTLNTTLNKLLENYSTRLVLTAHPTQFYPNVILAIIKELGNAIKNNDSVKIRDIFLQMGLTSFNNTTKPTPSEEANSIIWYLENIFYTVIPQIQHKLPTNTKNLDIGFWPGGDRDGNPFVTAAITLETANKLHNSIHNAYYQDIKNLRIFMTFNTVHDKLTEICDNIKMHKYKSHLDLISELLNVKAIVIQKYQSLFIEKIDDIILKIEIFKFHFAKIDIRQNSEIHRQVIQHILQVNSIENNYLSLSHEAQLQILLNNWQNPTINLDLINESVAQEVIDTIKAIGKVQEMNGRSAIERYIISNNDSVVSVIEVLWMTNLVNLRLSSQEQIQIEVVPLFETIADLKAAEQIMETLYNLPEYKSNLEKSNMKQTIMLGFSDGTKDGGYLSANWAIFQAKKRLSNLAKKYSIDVTFFDGRGGPPSRGGCNTNEFYQSLAQEIGAHDIQLTIQGQTISANYGTLSSATYNFEQLLSAGLSGRLFNHRDLLIDEHQEQIIQQLSDSSLETYLELRDNPLFIDYLEEITPLNYLTKANIGSRPAKRSKDSKLRLEDLRAIPFGGAWMQMKQNILGYYGFGSALQKYITTHTSGLKELKILYTKSRYFRGLVHNSMQSLASSNFKLTEYLKNDSKFGHFWQQIKHEAELSKQILMTISDKQNLIVDTPVKQLSHEFREEIILPLLLIQQFAMSKLRTLDKSAPEYVKYEHLVQKSIATNINASHNSI